MFVRQDSNCELDGVGATAFDRPGVTANLKQKIRGRLRLRTRQARGALETAMWAGSLS